MSIEFDYELNDEDLYKFHKLLDRPKYGEENRCWEWNGDFKKGEPVFNTRGMSLSVRRIMINLHKKFELQGKKKLKCKDGKKSCVNPCHIIRAGGYKRERVIT